MKIALRISQSNLGITFPNPTVGCILVKDDVIIGKGVTQANGQHAEYVAITTASTDLKDATMYVTLEPCCHYGNTPPCTKLIIKHGIKTVVVSASDPNQKITGNGIKELRQHGIEVIDNVCYQEASELHYGFIKRQRYTLPMVTAKLVTSIDGKIATNKYESKWISNKQARLFSHKLRSQNNAIIVGSNTFLRDLPQLTCRLSGFVHSKFTRVIMDRKLRTLKDIQRQNLDINTIIMTEMQVECKEYYNITVIQYDGTIRNALTILAKMGFLRILIEGGSHILTDFIRHDMIDKLVLIRAPIMLGDASIPAVRELLYDELKEYPRFNLQNHYQVDDNILEFYSK